MTLAGKLAGFVFDLERRDTPQPIPPRRPVICPVCHSGDIHGGRPCVLRKDLDEADKRSHDWHCHTCAWSAHVGDRRY